MESQDFDSELIFLKCFLDIQGIDKWAAATAGWTSKGRWSEVHTFVTLRVVRGGV